MNSDHLPVTFTMPAVTRNKTTTYRQIKKINWRQFRSKIRATLQTLPIQPITPAGIDTMLTVLTECIQRATEESSEFTHVREDKPSLPQNILVGNK